MSLNLTDASGNTWYIDNYGNLQNATKAGYGSYGSTSFSVKIGASTSALAGYSWSYGAATTAANTQTVTMTQAAEALSLTRKAYVGNGFVRVLEVVTNTGTTSKNLNLSLYDDVYHGYDTRLLTTSSGDSTYTAGDDWFMVDKLSAERAKAVHVVSGGAGSPNSVTLEGADIFSTSFNFDLAAGQTKVIMHFYALGADQATATTTANSLKNFASSDYLVGLTAVELNALVNFPQNISSASTATLQTSELNLILTGAANINGMGNYRDNTIIGTSGNNILNGGAGNDTLIGGAGNDTMNGGAGNDTFVVDSALDVVNELANEGVDTVKSSVSYNISAQPYLENITLAGSAAINATGNAINNILDGSLNTAANILAGGAGNDTYIVGAGDSVVEAVNAGTDTVKSAVNLTLGANIEHGVLLGAALNLTGNSADNSLTGNVANNILIGGAGNDTLNGAAGADRLIGGIGNDTYYVDNINDVITELAGEGTDTVISSINYTLSSTLENLTLSGNAFKGVGNSVNNVLIGNAKDNYLDGGAGADTMSGGAGSDIYLVDNPGDVVVELAGAGIDSVLSRINYTLGANVENGTLLGAATTMNGNAENNQLSGNAANNILNGGQGNDTLNGHAGNDLLNGGDGDDVLIGDYGTPEIRVGAAEAIINGKTVALNISVPESATGSITLSGTVSAVNLAQTPINLVYVLDNSGSMSANFSGEVDIGDLNGDGAGNTTLDAAIASFQKLNQSIIDSGLGSQVKVALIPFSSTASLAYSGSASLDSDSNGRADIGDILSQLRLAGSTNYTDAINKTITHLSNSGSGQNIVFFATDGAPDNTNYLSLLPALRALGQNGTVIRALGMGAGANNATLDILDDGIVNNSASIVLNPEELDIGLLNTSVLAIGEGAWVEVYRNGQMVDLIGSERFTVTPLGLQFHSNAITLSGSATDQITAKLMTLDSNGAMLETSLPVSSGAFVSNDTLVGGAGNDLLDGGVGTDSMVGGMGNDTYIVDNLGDKVIENAGEGTDLVKSKLASYTLGGNVENLELIGAAVNGTGNELNNQITGNELNNVLIGGAGNDSLTGGAGNDTLDGGGGNDTMIGGIGNDTYVLDSTSDYVTENSNEGIDTVKVSFNATLGGYVSGISTSKYFYNIENLTLSTGTIATNAVGSNENNVLIGNENNNQLFGLFGNDTLNGGAGADTMNGGEGNDTYYVDNAADVVIDTSGVDTVVSYLNNYVLGSALENLTLANSATVLAGTGNSLANKITGNSYNNTLNGGGGADTMAGGAGDDIYIVDNALDRIIEGINTGTDSVRASVSYKLSSNLENLTLLGSAGIAGAGNELANSLLGNAGNNRLLGYLGNDVLNGGAGADTMVGGDGSDVYFVDNVGDVVSESNSLASTGGIDHVHSYLSAYTLGANIENGRILATGTANLTGNSLNNVLYAGAGNNVLDGSTGTDTVSYAYATAGVTASLATSAAQATGGSGTDTLIGIERLTGSAYSDRLTGNSAANVLNGGAGNDVLNGGAGADALLGGTGNDDYLFARGDGADTLTDSDATAGNSDRLIFSGVNHDQLWFRSVGNNLEVSVVGTTDKVSITNWNLGTANHVEQIRAADGLNLSDAQVANLVNAMAGFAPPAAGQTSLPTNYHTALDSVIAANWS
jgi:Ca2+-binding RTX toxin-like protein